MSIIEEVKNKLDIIEIVSEYIDLAKKGKNFWGICPFHDDGSPSLSVSPEKQVYKCFSCGVVGDAIKFVSDYEKIPFNKALEKLSIKAGIAYHANVQEDIYSPKDKEILAALKDANAFFVYSLETLQDDSVKKYLQDRKLNLDDLKNFSIGYAPLNGLYDFLIKKGHDESTLINSSLLDSKQKSFFKNRLIFPIKNQYGDIVAFSGRKIGEEEGPKYINSAETQLFKKASIFYNYFEAQNAINKTKEIIICEGYMDVIAFVKSGINNVVAVMGTSLTKNHLPFLKNKKVFLNFDTDQAGINATIKSIDLLLENGIETSIIKNIDGKDVDTMFNLRGKESVVKLQQNNISAIEFIYEMSIQNLSSKDAFEIEKIIKFFTKYLKYANPIIQDIYINKLSESTNVSRNVISSYVPGSLSKKYISYPKKQAISSSENLFTKNKINFSYAIIRSLINKPMLLKIYIKHKTNYIDPKILEISNFLIENYPKIKTKPSKEISNTFNEIHRESDYRVETEEELIELINRVNNETKKIYKKQYDIQLDKTINIEEKIELLEKIKKLSRKKDSKETTNG